MTHIYSSLGVFLKKIGLVMLLCLLVLVRNTPISSFGMCFFPFLNIYIYIGVRACIGRKYSKSLIHFQSKSLIKIYLCLNRFFETEGVAALTMLVSRYKIMVKEEPQFANETFEERKTRVLATRAVLTLTYVFVFFVELLNWFFSSSLPFYIGLFVFLWSSLAVEWAWGNFWVC